MKSFYLSGILLLTFIGGLVFSTPSSAASTPVSTVQAATRPTKLEIEQAILKVRGIGNYEHYFPTASSPALDSSVKFYQEYNYLRTLVATARQLLASYDTASTDDLLMIIAATQDAEIACNLKFGITRQQSATKAEVETQSQTPTTPATPAAATPQAPTASTTTTAESTAQPTTAKTVVKATSAESTKTSPILPAVAKAQPAQPAAPQTIADIPAGSVPTPANSNLSATTATDPQPTPDSNPRAELLAHGSTATIATCFIGAVVYNERRTYRPGRSRN